MIFLLKDILKAVFLPPGLLLLSLLFGIFLLKGHKYFAVIWLLFTCTVIYLLSTPFISSKLTASLTEPISAINLENDFSDVAAIVVLSSKREHAAAEYNGDTVGQDGLVRIRYAAKLANKFTNLPVICSGGKNSFTTGESEAALMQKVMAQEFGVKNEFFLEEESKTTKENAKFTAAILTDKNIKKIFLVTQAWHMQRAVLAFNNIGVQVIPAPTEFNLLPPMPAWRLWLPNMKAMANSANCLHEYLGLFWYKLDFML